MFYKQNGIVAGILLLILFAGAIGLVSVQDGQDGESDALFSGGRDGGVPDGTDPAGFPKDGRAG